MQSPARDLTTRAVSDTGMSNISRPSVGLFSSLTTY
jgi:hypothetical protein